MEFEQIKTDMEFLGTYKKEFDPMIKIYLDAQNQYEKAWDEFKNGGMQSTVECAGGVKKNPILVTIEDLRKQIVTYSDRLGLNPKALDQIKNAQVTEEMTAVEKFFSEFNRGNNPVRQSDD